MKSRFMIASLLLAGICSGVNAQERQRYISEKASDNIFIGAGAGISSIINDGFNTPTFNFNFSLGKLITPVFGVRGQVGGLWYSLDQQDTQYHAYCVKGMDINLDVMVNVINLFADYNPNRKFDVYAFGGPTMNVTRAVDASISYDGNNNGQQINNYHRHGLKGRLGATVGLGAAYNINKKWAINLEGRFGATPSIFGDASDCRKAEAFSRWNLGATYTFGGKKFIPASAKVDKDALNEEINKYREELAQSQAELENTRMALKNAEGKTVEVTKEVQTAGTRAIFFKIGSAKLDDYGKVNIKLAAKTLKANPDKKYKVAGYADKATGSAALNQKLSEKRAQVVYDALIAEGVNKEQLELVGFGGTDNMFEKNFLNRVVILE